MMTFIIIIHVIICLGLIGIVLIQRGRGSGLVESFQGVESMFGARTSAFLTRTTTVLSVLFFITCLTLAFLSLKQSRSLMRDIKTQEQERPVTQKEVTEQTPQPQSQVPAVQEPPKEPVKSE